MTSRWWQRVSLDYFFFVISRIAWMWEKVIPTEVEFLSCFRHINPSVLIGLAGSTGNHLDFQVHQRVWPLRRAPVSINNKRSFWEWQHVLPWRMPESSSCHENSALILLGNWFNIIMAIVHENRVSRFWFYQTLYNFIHCFCAKITLNPDSNCTAQIILT